MSQTILQTASLLAKEAVPEAGLPSSLETQMNLTPAQNETAVTLRSEWIHTQEGFDRLQQDWQTLFAQTGSRNAFLVHGWMATWWKHWGDQAKLAIVAVRNQQGELLGLAPFYISRVRGLRRLGFLADARVGSDYLGILMHPAYEAGVTGEVVRALAAHRKQWDYLEFQDAQDSPQFNRFADALEASGMTQRRMDASVCPFAELPPTVEAYLGSLSGGWRRDYGRRNRVLERENGVEFVALTSREDMERAFPDLVRLHGMRFDQQELDSAFLKPGVPEFHAEALKSMADGGWARMFLLRTKAQTTAAVADETIAALYGFAVGSGFQYYQLGIDPGWQKSGLGKVIMGRVIGHSIENGCVEFDMLRGGEGYKANWVNQTRKTLTVRFFDRRWRSGLAQAGFRARLWASQGKAFWNQKMAERRNRNTAPAAGEEKATETKTGAGELSK